jgi:hypothetical protein
VISVAIPRPNSFFIFAINRAFNASSGFMLGNPLFWLPHLTLFVPNVECTETLRLLEFFLALMYLFALRIIQDP